MCPAATTTPPAPRGISTTPSYQKKTAPKSLTATSIATLTTTSKPHSSGYAPLPKAVTLSIDHTPDVLVAVEDYEDEDLYSSNSSDSLSGQYSRGT